MVPTILANIVVVLYQPKDPINIGTVVRAMRNTGFSQLRLVEPASDDARRINLSAPRSEAQVQAIRRFPSITDALYDVTYTVGLTARTRKANYTVMHAREAASVLLPRATMGKIALVFGREDWGLPNEVLTRCDAYVTIPANPEYTSFNLAQAVLLMLYELFLAAQNQPLSLPQPKRKFPQADRAELEGMYAQIESALWRIEFIKSRTSRGIMRTLRHIFSRTELDEREVRVVRGIFHEILKFLERKGIE